jgi:4-hydroxy-4-methyl-2-oxoglutarate aldolase
MMGDVQDLEGLTTAHLADACRQQGMDPRLAPQELVPMVPGVHVTGRVLPVRHSGSVDIFIEAISQAEPGSVLVIDDNGRRDQACIDDLPAPAGE